MNRLFKYSYIALLTVFALGFSACTEECEYTPAQLTADDCIKATFTSDGDQHIVSANSEKKVTISVNREKTDSEYTAQLKVLPTNDSHFTIPESVTFAAGQASTTFDITFSDIEAEELYTYSVALDEASVDNYDENVLASTTGAVLLEANWDQSLGQGTYTLSGLGQTRPCEVRKTSDEAMWFKAVAPFAKDNDLVFKVNEDNTIKMRKQPVCMVNVGLPDPVMLYVSLNPQYGGIYDPEQNAIIVVLDYTCSAGPLGTYQDVLMLPSNK